MIEMKQRNPTWGCPRIAEQINLAFGTCINKDVVRRILAKHYPRYQITVASWLTFLGHVKDSLWIRRLSALDGRLFSVSDKPTIRPSELD